MKIIQGTDTLGFKARAERRPTQGRVIDVDKINHTATVDVGNLDVSGTPIYLYAVPYQAQTPPSIGDNVTLGYTNSSPHSVYVAMSQLSGQNGPNSITVVGGVSSLKVDGETSGTKGDLAFVEGAGVHIVHSGVNFTFSLAVPVLHAGTAVSTFNKMNFIEGSGASLTVAANGSDASQVDITVSATGTSKRGMYVYFLEAAQPTATGVDTFTLTLPPSPDDGVTSITWNFRKLLFRIEQTGGSGGPIAVNLQSSSGTGVFSGTNVLTSDLQIAAGSYEASVGASGCVSGQTSWASGTKLRCNITAVAPGFRFWNVALLLEEN